MQTNQSSVFKHKEFVEEAIMELVNNGCVQRVSTVLHVCSPLSAVCNTEGKKRLVVNLRCLNHFLKKDSFKYEDLRTLLSILKPNDYLFKFDLKSGYHHVEMFESHWKYLGGGNILCVHSSSIWPCHSLLCFHKTIAAPC